MSHPLTEEHIVSAHQQAPNVRTATSIRVNPPLQKKKKIRGSMKGVENLCHASRASPHHCIGNGAK